MGANTMMKIIDRCDAYLKMCEKIEADTIKEHSFVVSVKGNKILGEACTEEVIDLEKYQEKNTSYHIVFHRNTLRGIIRAFKKSGDHMIFVHSHSSLDDNIELDFSDKDKIFEEKIVNIAREESYTKNIFFMIINLHKYKIHLHNEYEEVQYVIPYERQSLCDPEIHICDSGSQAIMYSRSRNSIFRIDRRLVNAFKGTDNNFSFAKKLAVRNTVYQKLSNIDAVYIVDKPNFIEKKKINKLELMVSMECNLSCRYCYAQGGSYGKNMGLMTRETVNAVFRMLQELNVEDIFCVSFFGGEPTLAVEAIKETCKIVKAMKKQGKLKNIPIYTIITNGTIYNSELKQILIDNKIRVTVSIDGSCEINDILRVYKNGKGTYKIISRNIHQMIEDGVNVVALEATYTSLHKKMGYKLQDVDEYLKREFQIKEIFIGQCEGSPKYEIDHFEDERLFIDNLDKECVWEVKCGLNQGTSVTANRCGAGIHNITITPNGDLYPCHQFLCMEGWEMGNIFDINSVFMKIKEVQCKLIEQNKANNVECKNCWAQILCKGCPADSFNDLEKKRQGCKLYRKKLEHGICAIQ